MNVLRLFILFLMMTSLFACKKYDEEVEFEAKLFVELLSTYQVQIPHAEYYYSVEPLQSPPATWQTLVRFKKMSETGARDEILCLSYQMPYEKMKILGELRLEEANAQGLCQPGTEKKLKAKLSDIKKLSFFLSDKIQLLKNDQKELKAYTLYLKLERLSEENWFELPLINLEKGQILIGESTFKGHQFSKERYAQPLIERQIPGSLILPYGKSPRLLAPSEGIGEFNDSYAEKKIVRCHDMKPDCTELKAYSCDECRYGWYEVSGSRCFGGYIKFCGVRRCGGKNEVACPRGTHFSQLSNLCFEGSNAAFCEEGLHTYCDENGILICK